MSRTRSVGALTQGVVIQASNALVLLLTVAIAAQALARHFFGMSSPWVHELSEYALGVLTFIGAYVLVESRDHITVDLISGRLSPTTLARLDVAVGSISAMVSLVVAWFGFHDLVNSVEQGRTFPTILRLPQAPFVAAVPLSFLLMAVAFLRQANGARKFGQTNDGPVESLRDSAAGTLY